VIEVVLGLVVVGFLAVLVFGLVTRRIAWRQQACCAPADPAHDLRMRDTTTPDKSPVNPTTTSTTSPSRRAEP
jgi:hypothetical protein